MHIFFIFENSAIYRLQLTIYGFLKNINVLAKKRWYSVTVQYTLSLMNHIVVFITNLKLNCNLNWIQHRKIKTFIQVADGKLRVDAHLTFLVPVVFPKPQVFLFVIYRPSAAGDDGVKLITLNTAPVPRTTLITLIETRILILKQFEQCCHPQITYFLLF